MKAEIKIPRGFEKVKVGYLAIKGDYILASTNDGIKCFLEWQAWKDNHAVKRNEIFIRKMVKEIRSE